MSPAHKLLGTILQELEAITSGQLQEALQRQKESGTRVGEALQELGYCSAEKVCEALAQQYGLRYVDPTEMSIPAAVIELVPKKMAREHHVMPIESDNGRITLATADPSDLYALDNVRFYTNTEIDCVLATQEQIDKAINLTYGLEEETVDSMLQEFTESEILFQEEGGLETALHDVAGEDAPVIRLVMLIISEGIRRRASDIHIEPMEKRLRIRYRIDGVCQEVESPPPRRLQSSIISRVKIMAGIDIAEKRRPTDGSIKLKIMGKEIDLRVSCLPASHGESVVLRILDKQSLLLGVQDLGFEEEDHARFQSIIRRPNGILLVTGPTGSGKTTTLYAALCELNSPNRKIITAENPVEYHISGINQCQVNVAAGLTFERILRAMLRQSPEIILVGEIRDAETAEIAIQAALTGHLVFSTLHTNDAPSAITRLTNMGVPAFLVSTAVHAIMAQRLVRTLCPKCREEYTPKPSELEAIGLREEEIGARPLYQAVGCGECEHTGYRGRVGIYELLEMNEELRELAFQRVPYPQLRDAAIASGMTTLQRDGVRKVLAGRTSIEEVLRVTAEYAPAEIGEEGELT